MAIKSPPLPEKVRNISYPVVPEEQLPNGLRILLIEDYRRPQISVTLAFPVGRVNDPDHNLALIQVAVQLLREGTARRSAREISDLLDYWAIQYESEVTMEYTLLSVTALQDHLEPALDLFSDIVRHPGFPQEELDKIKVRLRSNLIAQRSQPDFLANERTFQTLYPAHPYSKVSIPIEHLDQVDRESVRGIYERYYVPNDAFLLFAGPLNPERTMELARRFFGDWQRQNFPALYFPPAPPIARRTVCLVHRPHSVQSRITVAGRALPRAHPEAIALQLANHVLGGGASARLFMNLREDKGYTYGAYSMLKSYRYEGAFLASANVKTDVTLESINEFLKEMEKLQSGPPTEDELIRCQAELIGAFLRRTETPASVGALELNRRLYQLPEDYYQTFIPNVRRVTPEETLEMAKRFYDTARILIIVVADREQLESGLSQLGELQIYDTLGSRIQ